MHRELIGNVAHKPPTPLTNIKGCTEGLIDGVLPPEPETYQLIYHDTNHLQRLVNDLQKLSRVEASAFELNRQTPAVADLIKQTAARLRPHLRRDRCCSRWKQYPVCRRCWPRLTATRFERPTGNRNEAALSTSRCRAAGNRSKMTIETTLLVLLIFVAAAGTHTIFGFGFGLVSMPLLALTIDIKIATPLVALVSNSVSLYLLTQYWREIELKSAWKLILASAVGTPLGLLLVKCAPGNLVTGLLGLLLIALGLYNLTQPRLPQLQWPHWAFGFGFAAGILGSAYNTSGPPVIIYGTLRRWSSNRFRATLQSYFVPAGLVVIISHGVGGLWTTEVFWLALLSLPALLLGLVVGLLIGRRISGQRFTQALYICLILLGLLLLS